MRPLLHHTTPSGWVNDPHALVHHGGRYHLFFQHVPGRATWGVDCHWGHATSSDLLTWEAQPPVLAPDQDEDGCWSGSLVATEEETVAFYTAVDAPDTDVGRVRRAVPSDDSWQEWVKQDVVVTLPAGVDATQFRDPFVARDGNGWRMLMGGATSTGEASVWAFRSPDLISWTYAGVAASRSSLDRSDSVWTGTGWECPTLLEVDGRTVLLVSVWQQGGVHPLAYALCDPSGDDLRPGRWRQLSYGTCHFAAATFRDAEHRPGIIAWLRDAGDADAGWAGAHTLPMSVALDGDRLVVSPHPAVDQRRGPRAATGVLPAIADVGWAPAPGDSLNADSFTLIARTEVVTLTAGAHRVDLPWAGEPLRLVLDGPVLELFGSHGVTALPIAAVDESRLTWTGPEPTVHRLTGT